VPYLVLSATMTSYVRGYVHHSLRLSDSTPNIHRPVDRPEIYLSARIAQHPLDSHKDLDFLFQEGMTIEEVVPTIVFADSRAEVCQAATRSSRTEPQRLAPLAPRLRNSGLEHPPIG
jgi:superfamily II DNA helicase RecQ